MNIDKAQRAERDRREQEILHRKQVYLPLNDSCSLLRHNACCRSSTLGGFMRMYVRALGYVGLY